MIGGMCVCLYVYECALLERWVYVLCYVSCLSFFLPILGFLKGSRIEESDSQSLYFYYFIRVLLE